MKWKTEQRRIDQLVPHPENPRQMTEKQVADLKESLTKFDLAEIPAINTDNQILAGHQRLKIMAMLGKSGETIDVRVPDRELTEAECKEYLIRSNKNTGEWDFDMLANHFDMPELQDWGFEPMELADFDMGEDVEEDEPPEPPDDPLTKRGDLWKLGEHRVLCGDSTKSQDVARLLQGQKPNLMVTDPPYGVEYDPAWRNKVGISATKRIGKVENDDRSSWASAYAHFPGDVAYVWHAGKYASIVERSLAACGFEVRSQIIWAKNRFALSRGQYHWRHEPCWFAVRKNGTCGWKGGRKQSTIWADIVDQWSAGAELFAAKVNEHTLTAFDGSMTTVWEIAPKEEATTSHGTQKPVECMARPIRNHEGDVYDGFLGSGTTLIAAEQLGRICYGMEISPGYVDVTIQRWEKLTGKTATLETKKGKD